MPPRGPDIFHRPEENNEEDKANREKERNERDKKIMSEQEEERNRKIIDEQSEDPVRAGRGGARRTQKKEMIEGRMELQFLEREDLEEFIQMLLAEEEKRKNHDQRDALRSLFDERIETKLGVLRVSFLGGLANERQADVGRILDTTEWTEDKKKGINGLFEFYLKAERDAARGLKGKKSEEMEKLLFGRLKIKDLTKEERETIMRTLTGELVLYKMLLDDAILRSAVDDEDTYKRITEIARTLGPESDALMILRKIESVIVENAQKEQNIALAKLLELGTIASSILHEEPKEEVKIQKEVIHEKQEDDMPLSAKLLESVSSFTDIGKKTVRNLLRTGKSDVAITIMQESGARETANGIQANVAGGILEAELRDDQTVNVYYTSEDGKKILIDLSLEPLPAALDHARISAMNRTMEVSLLMGQRGLNDMLLHALGGIDVRDTAFMENTEANDWRRMLKILLWKKAAPRDERSALQELGLLEENDHMNLLRAAWLRLYLKYRKSQGGLEGVTFDELRKITRQWDADGSFSVTTK